MTDRDVTAESASAPAPSDRSPEEAPSSPEAGGSAPGGVARSATPVVRNQGVTSAERYLQRLCDRSFLRMWSYPGVYRDQGADARGEGKEVCDLLVVFGTHLIIFSDKDCAFPSSGNLAQDWSRWFRRAVLKSAEQVWGAERWLLDHPGRICLDPACKTRFPIALPTREEAVVHRIVVAHGVSDGCRAHWGGTGSLMVMPAITGADHYRYPAGSVLPFAVGDLDPARGYVHVLDDQSLEVLVTTLDTITDFVEYLTTKEAFIRSGKLLSAAGEDDLLAFYLKRADASGHHVFLLPAEEDVTGVVVDEGHWGEFQKNPQRIAQLAANGVSYFWDELIETFAGHLLAGTSVYRSHGPLREMEPLMRWMAAESRTRRRMLAEQLLDVVAGAPLDRYTPHVRVLAPGIPGLPHYVFLALARKPGQADAEYRSRRKAALEAYLLVTRFLHPDAVAVVGIAADAGLKVQPRSEDAMGIDSRDWTPEMEARAKELHEFGLLRTVRRRDANTKEYPDVPAARPLPTRPTRTTEEPPSTPSIRRQGPCPCGSGKKYKRCCGS